MPSQTPSPTFTKTPTRTSSPSPTAIPLFETQPEIIDTKANEHARRPGLSGTVRVVDTRHFRLFYTISGDDAVRMKDDNGNAIPDYVETVARTLELAWRVLIDDLGWAAPPPDSGRGGNDLLDVYIMDLDFTLTGIAEGGEIDNIVGDNPNTPVIEQSASFSFLRLDNDFAEIEKMKLATSTVNLIRTTAVHEFMHALQFGYDGLEPASWIWEATSTWAETIVLKTVTDVPMHLTAAFKSPDTCLLSYGGIDRREDYLHWYSRWLFLRFISDRYGLEVIRGIWEQAVFYDGYAAIDAALSQAGTNLQEVIREYEIALLLREFEFKLDYPTVRLETTIDGTKFYRPINGVGQLGADFIEINTNSLILVKLRQIPDGLLIGVNNNEADVYYFEDGTATIHAGQYQYVYLVVINFNRAKTHRDCNFEPYSVEIMESKEKSPPQFTIQVLEFKPPFVELLSPVDEIFQ